MRRNDGVNCDESKNDDVKDIDTATSSSGEKSGGDDVTFSVMHGITIDLVVSTGLSVL